MCDSTHYSLLYLNPRRDYAGHSMGDENEPDQAANNKDYRDGNEYLLQYFHIFPLIRLMCMSRQRIFGICS